MIFPFASFPTRVRRLLLTLSLGLLACLMSTRAGAQETDSNKETVIELKTIGGLRFDPPRFAVEPGAKVKVLIENLDDMAHNFVLLQPGARMEIVQAANVMPIEPTSNYIPKSDKIIQHSPLLNPSKSATITFTAPTKEDAYPFVCTFPGHGLIMYGAMYVTKKPMPPIAKDMNLPDMIRDANSGKSLHAFTPTPPFLYRTFLRDCGPAAIAVSMPNGQSYCWDAGACRLRYAWSGAFLDPVPHWSGNGDSFAEVKGRIYYRAQPGYPLHFGAADKAPAVKFLGYRLVNRFPEFHYLVDGVDVRELTKPLHHGTGFETTFTVGATAKPLLYTFDPQAGASLKASAGTIKDGVLTLTPEQAKSFTLTFTEVLGREPLRYWSMNDVQVKRKAGLVEAGVKGRAVNFYGIKGSEYEIDVNSAQLPTGATFAAWVKVQKPGTPKAPSASEDSAEGAPATPAPAAAAAATPAPALPDENGEQVILGVTTSKAYFWLGWNVAGQPGFGLAASAGDGAPPAVVSMGKKPDKEWHHLAFTSANGTLTLYCDGQIIGTAKGTLPAKSAIFLGSAGGSRFAAAHLDEVRLDDRAYTAAEIAALYRAELPATTTPSAQ